MSTIPTTQKALRTRITSYRTKLRKEYEATGYYSDGYGKRLWIFYLYYLYGDLNEAAEYMEWYEQEFPDDSGEATQYFCWALLLRQMGREQEAVYRLACAISDNIMVVESLMGCYEGPYGMWSEDTMDLYAAPDEVKDAVTDEEMSWLHAQFASPDFAAYRARYIEIYQDLGVVKEREGRVKLLDEQRGLLDGLKVG